MVPDAERQPNTARYAQPVEEPRRGAVRAGVLLPCRRSGRSGRPPARPAVRPGGLRRSLPTQQRRVPAPRAFRRHKSKRFIAAHRARPQPLSPNRGEPRPRPRAGHRAEPRRAQPTRHKAHRRQGAQPPPPFRGATPRPNPGRSPGSAARARGRPGSAQCGRDGATRRWRRCRCCGPRAADSASTTALGEAQGGRGAGLARARGSHRPRGSLRYRNSLLEAQLGQEGRRLPAARKTGTTIAGVVFKVSGRVRRGGGAGAGGARGWAEASLCLTGWRGPGGRHEGYRRDGRR